MERREWGRASTDAGVVMGGPTVKSGVDPHSGEEVVDVRRVVTGWFETYEYRNIYSVFKIFYNIDRYLPVDSWGIYVLLVSVRAMHKKKICASVRRGVRYNNFLFWTWLYISELHFRHGHAWHTSNCRLKIFSFFRSKPFVPKNLN